MREENGPQARRFLEEAERTVEAMAPEVRKASAWEAALERYRWQLRFLEKEDPAQLLEEVRSRLERPESLRLQVMDHYHAACCLRALGWTEEACPHLEFAAEFGGGLEVRRRAADLLKELQRPETL